MLLRKDYITITFLTMSQNTYETLSEKKRRYPERFVRQFKIFYGKKSETDFRRPLVQYLPNKQWSPLSKAEIPYNKQITFKKAILLPVDSLISMEVESQVFNGLFK